MISKNLSYQPTRALRQAQLPLHFVIVGGGLSGLSSAIALTRVGHRVTVLEQQKEFPQTAGALRIPPNQTKILGHWGLRAEAEKIGLKSRAVAFTRYEGNLHLGHHFWDEEVLRECGGDWLLVRYSAFHAFLLECARANGATIRLGARVSQVAENETATVILDNGEHVRGDVIIAADGEAGLARKAVIGREERVQGNGLVMYSAMVPLEEMSANPELATLLRVGDNHPPVTVWFGDSRTAVGYPVGEPFYQLYFYAPLTEEMGPNVSVEWDRDFVSREELVKSLGDDADPRMKTLANLAVPHMSTRIAMQEFEQLDDWVHDDIPLVLLGDAAHPSVMGMIQSSAMIMEDAAALAKLFSHVHRSEQIPKLLSAFFTLRQARTHSVLAGEMANVRFMSLSNSDPIAQGRDANFISRRDQGLNVLDAGTSSDEAAVAQWEEIRETWAYDAEDDADDWWVAWGATAERAIAASSPIGQGAFIDFSNSFASAVQMSTTVEG